MTDVQFVASQSIDKLNKHWNYCRKNGIPYLTVRRSRCYSDITWDLWSIDVAFLGLNKTALEELDRYVQGLMDHGDCVEATFGATECGFAKVKRELEIDVLETLWKIVSDAHNWITSEVAEC